jgi:hypothetical protein
MPSDDRSLDPDIIRATARADYEEMRQLARKPGATVAGTGAEIDAELDRRTRAHVADMKPAEAAQFLQIYNAEYNRLVTERFQQQRTGCAASVVIGITILIGILYSAWAAVP